jgi:hypothetical protein
MNVAWHAYDKAHTIDPDDELESIRAFVAQGYPQQ